MKNFVMSGKVLAFTAAAAVSSGQGVLLGSTGLFGVSTGDVASGEVGQAEITGVFTLPKTSADTPAKWANAYWDDTNKEVTTSDGTGANTLIGVFTEAYGAGTTEADVLLLPSVA